MLTVVARGTGRLADAWPHLREAVQLAAYASYRIRMIDAIEEAGYWSAANGRCEAAVTLWAARDAQLQAIGLTDKSAEDSLSEQPLREAMRTPDAGQIRAANQRGAAMTLAAAAEYAIITTGKQAPHPGAPGPGKLSSRERELITLVAQGQTDAQIARQLFISISTVRSHLDRIRDKSGCRRRADLTRLALQEGII